jgi:DNA ligase-1
MKPMLACSKTITEADFGKLRFPLVATPKFDGIRCLTFEGGAPTSRNLKPIQNDHIRETLTMLGVEGLDGELMVPGAKDFGTVSSAVMGSKGTPDFEYWVFDLWMAEGTYVQRLQELAKTAQGLPSFIKFVRPRICNTPEELLEFEVECLEDGFEGVITRAPESKYKFGRSTKNEQGMLKLKRFHNSEAVIVDCLEEQANLNPAKKNALGRTERSSAKAGKVGKGSLGKFVCRDLTTGVEFEIGTGFTAAQRAEFWLNKPNGHTVKYKFQPAGAKDEGKPRFPVFLGFRHADDMSS